MTSQQPQVNGEAHSSLVEELENWQSLARERDNKIQQLEEENTRLRESVNELKVEVQCVTFRF